MSDKKKKSVGAQFLVRDKSGELVAILQVRSKWNAEKNTPETWPGACQATAHGKLESGEDFIQALFREIKEELGEKIVPEIEKLRKDGKLKELVNEETKEKHTITYGVVVGENVFKMLFKKEKNDSFGGFKIIRANEIVKIVDLQTIDKTTGIMDEKTIAMFPDEKQAVEIAFKKLD